MRSDLRPAAHPASHRTAAPRPASHRTAATLAALTVLALGAGTAPALAEDPAPPAPATVGIGRAVTEEYQRGAFHVNVWTDAATATVTTVSAKIRKNDTVVTEIPALTQAAWNKNYFSLPAGTALKLTEDGGGIPELGRYAIDITATDSLGHTLTRTDAGTLDFTLKPQLDLGFSAPSWDDRSTRPSGTLLGVQPGSGDLVPISGGRVSVQRLTPDTGTAQTATTDETGAFTGEPYADVRIGDEFRVSYAENNDQVHGSYAFTRSIATVRSRQVTVTATADRTRLLPGEKVTVTGRMTDPANADAPLAEQQLRVGLAMAGYTGSPVWQTVSTDADGRFTAQLPSAPGTRLDSWVVSSVDPFLSFPGVSGPLAMPQEGRVVVYRGLLAADGKVNVIGAFRPWYNPKQFFGHNVPETLLLENSADGLTGWRTIATYAANESGFPVLFNLNGRSQGGFFRVRHVLSDAFAETTGATFRLVRTPTRIVGVNANPEPVRKGAAMTVTGTLQQQIGSTWKVYGNAPVTLWFQARGSTAWKQLATGRTAANGVVTFPTKATVDGSYTLRHNGDGSHFNAPAAYADYVDVR
ncbi:hypothetical protein [Streptomyces sp. NPDC053431]|uniref:hypothetical protein n=1 Tax=Streptomyces sp. NPDC053431 TaxID=3365703 RepID=UPI0037D6404E